MKLLFIHPNHPSQFEFAATALARDPANQVLMLSRKNLEVKLPGVRVIGFHEKAYAKDDTSPKLHKFIDGCHRADAVANVCLSLKRAGFVPDVIVAHAGWGDALYVKSVFPGKPLLNYMEFYFHASGADVGFFPGRINYQKMAALLTTNNAIHALNYFNADSCVTPTYWQRSVHPVEMRDKFNVLHEGVDTDRCRPASHDRIVLPNGFVLHPETDEIITHVERFFENYRGFPTFIKAVELIQRRRPNAHVLVVGKKGSCYGDRNEAVFDALIKNTGFDRNRTHFLGHLPYADYLRVLQVSSAHIYLTCPFVLSWSFLEAMSVGCPVVCSNTPPVAEVGEDQVNCLMFDFFSPRQLADQVDKLLDDRQYARRLGQAARRKMVEQYDRARLLPMFLGLITDLAEGRGPGRAAAAIAAWNRQWGREEADWQQKIPLFGGDGDTHIQVNQQKQEQTS